MKNVHLLWMTVASLTGCIYRDDDTDCIADRSLQVGVNLSDRAVFRDTFQFDHTQPSTYTSSVSVSVDGDEGGSRILSLYFVRIQSLHWDVYVTADGIPVHVENGSVGSFGRYKATLDFDQTGALVGEAPHPIITEELTFPDSSRHRIEVDFSSHGMTALSAINYGVSTLSVVYGCTQND